MRFDPFIEIVVRIDKETMCFVKNWICQIRISEWQKTQAEQVLEGLLFD
jgi:hypothetical protein